MEYVFAGDLWGIMKKQTKTIHAVCCDDCPILNHDCESGGSCNLDHQVNNDQYTEPDGATGYYYSTDCRLESIMHDKTLFTPEWKDIEVIEMVYEPSYEEDKDIPEDQRLRVKKWNEKLRHEAVRDSVFARGIV